MNFSFGTGHASTAKADVLVLPLFDTDLTDKKHPPSAWVKTDKKMKGLLVEDGPARGLQGQGEQTCVSDARQAERGSRDPPRAGHAGEVQRRGAAHGHAGRAVKAANKLKAKTVVIQLPGVRELDVAIQSTVEGSILGSYRYDKWRTTNKDEKSAPRVDKVQLLLPDGVKKDKSMDCDGGDPGEVDRRGGQLLARSRQRAGGHHDADDPRRAGEDHREGSGLGLHGLRSQEDRRAEDGHVPGRRARQRRGAQADSPLVHAR
jgi:hypothetical protein